MTHVGSKPNSPKTFLLADIGRFMARDYYGSGRNSEEVEITY